VVDGKVLGFGKERDLRMFVGPGEHQLEVGWSDGRVQRVKVNATAGGRQTVALDPPPQPKLANVSNESAPPNDQVPASKPFGPAIFFVSLGLTAVAGGLTVWSGMDTIKAPGVAAVKQECVGQGEKCPAYQAGLDSQRRTNILLATTSGLAAVTVVVGVFFTQWSSPSVTTHGAVTLEPVLGFREAWLKGAF
jgi:hypothetical protein